MAKVRGFEPRSQGFGDLHVTVTTHRQNWSGRQDSNLQPPAPKAGALPLAPLPVTGADDRDRTDDEQLGRLTLYH